MDLGEARKVVLGLLDIGRLEVRWDHIFREGHRVTEDEVRAALIDGAYAYDSEVEGRYIATYAERTLPLSVLVVFEIWEERRARTLTVVTAFHAEGRTGRRR